MFEYFRTPPDGTIIEITTMDVLEELKRYLTRHNLWRTQVDMDQFMTHLVDVYRVKSPYDLGIIIISMPLIMQVMIYQKTFCQQFEIWFIYIELSRGFFW